MRIVMMGTGTFAEPTFAALIAAGENVVGLITQPHREVGRKSQSSRLTGNGLIELAHRHGIPVSQPANINSTEGATALRELQSDLVVVAAYGQILKPDIIATPTHGLINVHASLLPKYRGAAPVAYAILNGETTTGVSIIRIAPGLDSGDILAQGEMSIHPNETSGELEARLAPLGAKLALDVVRGLKSGPISGIKQDPALVTKAPKLTKEMGAIDWTQPARKIRDLVRAMQPWPTAYTFYERPGKEPIRTIVCEAGFIQPLLNNESPGTLVSHTVACGDGNSLEIREIQPAGKKRMTIVEFLRGHAGGVFVTNQDSNTVK